MPLTQKGLLLAGIVDALSTLKETKGSTPKSIINYIQANPLPDMKRRDITEVAIHKAIRQACENKILRHNCGRYLIDFEGMSFLANAARFNLSSSRKTGCMFTPGMTDKVPVATRGIRLTAKCRLRRQAIRRRRTRGGRKGRCRTRGRRRGSMRGRRRGGSRGRRRGSRGRRRGSKCRRRGSRGRRRGTRGRRRGTRGRRRGSRGRRRGTKRGCKKRGRSRRRGSRRRSRRRSCRNRRHRSRRRDAVRKGCRECKRDVRQRGGKHRATCESRRLENQRLYGGKKRRKSCKRRRRQDDAEQNDSMGSLGTVPSLPNIGDVSTDDEVRPTRSGKLVDNMARTFMAKTFA